jgi:hypothetical protein
MSIDLYSFVETNKVRRGVKAHPVSSMCKDGRQEGGNRSLAVGSCNMDGGKTILRISETPHQAGNCGQSQLDPKASEAVKGGQVIVNGRDHEYLKSELKCLK